MLYILQFSHIFKLGKYILPRLPEIYQKPPKQGHLLTQDTLDDTNGVRIREVSLYIRVKTNDIACVTS